MLNLSKIKKSKAVEATNGGSGVKITAADLRVQKDIADIELPPTCRMEFPDPNNLQAFVIDILPDEGLYKKGIFRFSFTLPNSYPFEPPKVKCMSKIYHPNIDLEGNVCLNILREDWKPVLSVNAVIHGMLHLFYEPNPNDPLNHDAAKVLRANQSRFASNVQRSMRGQEVDGKYYDRVLL
eukprot:CFRG0410T1